MPVDDCVARARSCIGTRFLLHGRDPLHGLDCVGLVEFARGVAGDAPTGYDMRNSQQQRWTRLLDQLFIRRKAEPAAGDILLLNAGPAQFHLGIWTGNGLIHADAGLRRVVETPGPVHFPLIGIWAERRKAD
jgi:murein DD-endopeptidase / murein LD-carboxypeptidase